MKKFTFLALILSVIVFNSGCSQVENNELKNGANSSVLEEEYTPAVGKKGGSLVTSITADPSSFNRVVSSDNTTSTIMKFVMEGLVNFDPVNMEVVPWLAESWKISEDGLTVTFYLRKDVLWSDGEVFDADDVVFTFQDIINNPEIPSGASDVFTINGEKIDIVKVDDFTVDFILPEKFAPFMIEIIHPIFPEHKLASAVQDGTFPQAYSVETDLSEIIGTGPFVLNSYEPSQKIELKSNENYWMKDESGTSYPYLDTVTFLIVSNQDTTLLKFQNGELDSFAMRGSDFPVLKPNEAKGNYTVYDLGPTYTSNFLVMNQNSKNENIDKELQEFFKTKEFRRAISHAVDRESMIDIVFNGIGEVQDGPLTRSAGFFYNDSLDKIEYSPEKAMEMLDALNFIDLDGDGFRDKQNGEPLEISLITNSDNSERVKLAEMIRKDLETIGIKVAFSALDFRTVVEKLTATYDWEMILIGLTGSFEPHIGKNVWHSSANLHMWNPLQETPETDWEKRIDEIFTAGATELDENKRKVLYDEWQEIAVDQQALVYTVVPNSIVAVRNKFGNLYPTNLSGVFWNIEKIYIKDEVL